MGQMHHDSKGWVEFVRESEWQAGHAAKIHLFNGLSSEDRHYFYAFCSVIFQQIW